MSEFNNNELSDNMFSNTLSDTSILNCSALLDNKINFTPVSQLSEQQLLELTSLPIHKAQDKQNLTNPKELSSNCFLERQLNLSPYLVIGVDEVGRGCCFGPLVSAAACTGFIDISYYLQLRLWQSLPASFKKPFTSYIQKLEQVQALKLEALKILAQHAKHNCSHNQDLNSPIQQNQTINKEQTPCSYQQPSNISQQEASQYYATPTNKDDCLEHGCNLLHIIHKPWQDLLVEATNELYKQKAFIKLIESLKLDQQRQFTPAIANKLATLNYQQAIDYLVQELKLEPKLVASIPNLIELLGLISNFHAESQSLMENSFALQLGLHLTLGIENKEILSLTDLLVKHQDSKAALKTKREAITQSLSQQKSNIAFCIAQVEAQDIDHYGLQYANYKAMASAVMGVVEKLELKAQEIGTSKQELYERIIVLVDGINKIKYLPPHIKQFCLEKGDFLEHNISIASVIAKVYRDNLVTQYSREEKYSMYALDEHKGYITKQHSELISKYGPSDQHRWSYKNIANEFGCRPENISKKIKAK